MYRIFGNLFHTETVNKNVQGSSCKSLPPHQKNISSKEECSFNRVKNINENDLFPAHHQERRKSSKCHMDIESKPTQPHSISVTCYGSVQQCGISSLRLTDCQISQTAQSTSPQTAFQDERSNQMSEFQEENQKQVTVLCEFSTTTSDEGNLCKKYRIKLAISNGKIFSEIYFFTPIITTAENSNNIQIQGLRTYEHNQTICVVINFAPNPNNYNKQNQAPKILLQNSPNIRAILFTNQIPILVPENKKVESLMTFHSSLSLQTNDSPIRDISTIKKCFQGTYNFVNTNHIIAICQSQNKQSSYHTQSSEFYIVIFKYLFDSVKEEQEPMKQPRQPPYEIVFQSDQIMKVNNVRTNQINLEIQIPKLGTAQQAVFNFHNLADYLAFQMQYVSVSLSYSLIPEKSQSQILQNNQSSNQAVYQKVTIVNQLPSPDLMNSSKQSEEDFKDYSKTSYNDDNSPFKFLMESQPHDTDPYRMQKEFFTECKQKIEKVSDYKNLCQTIAAVESKNVPTVTNSHKIELQNSPKLTQQCEDFQQTHQSQCQIQQTPRNLQKRNFSSLLASTQYHQNGEESQNLKYLSPKRLSFQEEHDNKDRLQQKENQSENIKASSPEGHQNNFSNFSKKPQIKKLLHKAEISSQSPLIGTKQSKTMLEEQFWNGNYLPNRIIREKRFFINKNKNQGNQSLIQQTYQLRLVNNILQLHQQSLPSQTHIIKISATSQSHNEKIPSSFFTENELNQCTNFQINSFGTIAILFGSIVDNCNVIFMYDLTSNQIIKAYGIVSAYSKQQQKCDPILQVKIFPHQNKQDVSFMALTQRQLYFFEGLSSQQSKSISQLQSKVFTYSNKSQNYKFESFDLHKDGKSVAILMNEGQVAKIFDLSKLKPHDFLTTTSEKQSSTTKLSTVKKFKKIKKKALKKGKYYRHMNINTDTPIPEVISLHALNSYDLLKEENLDINHVYCRQQETTRGNKDGRHIHNYFLNSEQKIKILYGNDEQSQIAQRIVCLKSESPFQQQHSQRPQQKFLIIDCIQKNSNDQSVNAFEHSHRKANRSLFKQQLYSPKTPQQFGIKLNFN